MGIYVMYPLESVYGPKSFRSFHRNKGFSTSLKSEQQSPEEIWNDPLQASRYEELLEIVSFLSVMNKRQSLFFRGQGAHFEPVPAIFRQHWTSLSGIKHDLNPTALQSIWRYLTTRIPSIVDEVCSQFPMPRPATLKMFREAVWAIAQHYSLWPTPLIDVTPNLRVATSFALWTGGDEGNLYVVALPPSTNSVTYDADQHVVLARLQAVCPPEANRPHFQDGYLADRFPFEGPTPNRVDHRPREVSNLRRRLVARIQLKNEKRAGVDEPCRRSFWNSDFPPMSAASLTPPTEVDKLLKQFIRYAEEIDEAMRNICPAKESPVGYNPGCV